MNLRSVTSDSLDGLDVLAIDDNVNNLLVIRGMLKERGHRVRPATSGRLGLQAAEARPPDVILLDICMPEMDGYEVCRELKQRESLKDIPVIFLSALGDSIDKVRAFETGALDYVTKPFKAEEVAARIETHVTMRRMRQDLERRYEELRESERLREKLTHLIVHDLRSPLGVVVMGLDFVLRFSREKLDDSLAGVLESAFTQAEVINRMIDDLLDIARLEGKRMPIQPARQEVGLMVDEARASVALRGQQLSVDLSSAPAEVHCDGELVRRVLTNLVGNAARFTPAGGSIQVAVRRAPEGTRFEVKDTGPGIPPQFHGKIFEMFGQVEEAQSVKGRSNGLGLAFCRLAVEAHGGRIGVESEPGKGSLFWFQLPDDAPKLLQAA